MMNFEIKLSIPKLKKSGKIFDKGKDDRSFLMIVYRFCKYLKDLYIRLVIEQIKSSRYKGEWEPVEDESYLEYLGVTPKVSIITLLREALEVRKIGYSLYIRVNPEMKYPESDMTVLRVLRALENGTSEFPARPILRKVAQKINTNLTDLWLGWLSMEGLSERR